MLAFMALSKDELKELAESPYSKNNAYQMLDNSETLLEASQSIVSQIEKNGKTKTYANTIVDLAGRQRMLAERIAKYYIAYQAGFKDDDIVKQLNLAMNEFEKAQAILLNTKENSAAITKELRKVESLWKVVSKFYKHVKTGGLPVIVLSTTDKIMTSMNRVTLHYVARFNK